MELTYPAAPTSDQVDDWHGTLVADPYRPLEDPNAEATRAWVRAQNELSGGILRSIASRDEIARRLAQLWDLPRRGAPWHRGDHWFQLRNTGLQDQDVLWTSAGPEAEGRVLLDPNGLNASGTTTLNAIGTSDSGEYTAVALSDAGSDWQTWRVLRTADGSFLPDAIRWAKFTSAAWTRDDAGFFYGAYPEPPADAEFDAPNLGMQLRYHRLGTDASTDPVVFAVPGQPEWGFEPHVSDDGTLLVLTVWRGTDPENRLFVADLRDGVLDPGGLDVRPLIADATARWELVGTVGRELYLLTDADAPTRRLVRIDADDPGVTVHEVVAASEDALEGADLAGGRIAAVYLHDAHNEVRLFELDGTPAGEVALPGLASVAAASGRLEDPELFLVLDRFAAPRTLIAARMADGSTRTVAGAAAAWDPDDFVTEQVFVDSDGVGVPLFLTHRDIEPTGDIPTLLYAYGGFSIPIGPMFKAEWLAWMERGGLLAVASLRGGSEYGKAWHDDGRLANKQHVFDDFAACMRWLVAAGWTRADRIGISGRSNGGLLVGATLTQHPELFGAAIAEVGVMDMLRFHRFTIGWGWTSDYGCPDDPEQFRWVYAYSPLHNIRPGTAYPPTLVTTGDHDDRVVPGHSFKFTAALQAAQGGDAPVLIRVDTDAGHGAGKPVSKLIDERADVLAFLEMALGGTRQPS